MELFSRVLNKKFVITSQSLDVYKDNACIELATQGWMGRQLFLLPHSERSGVLVQFLEDGYTGWITSEDFQEKLFEKCFQGKFIVDLSPGINIVDVIPKVVEFVKLASQTENVYLWGGTSGPNYDCSGLVQRAFAEHHIWIPRDAYQQEEFCNQVSTNDVKAGDLVFFGKGKKATHVGFISEVKERSASVVSDGTKSSLEEKMILFYHSSGKDHGHNGIQVDELGQSGSVVGRHYFEQWRGFGRVHRSL